VSGFVTEAPQRRSPLAKVRHEASGALQLAKRTGLTLVHLAGRPGRTDFLDATRGALGVALPLAPNTSAHTDELTVFWLGPTRWLIACADADVEKRLRDADPQGAALADVSGGRVVILVSGEAARRRLAEDCPVDLHRQSLPPGAAVQTMLAGMSVMMHALPDGDAFDLYVARSYAIAAWEWLARID
jgi:sarcosine oxidase subunit gamma